MNKQLQDLAWRSLPPEVRKKMRAAYNFPSEDNYERGSDAALLTYFGHHNLISDEEYPEMLMIERSKVQEMYADVCDDITDYKGDGIYGLGAADPTMCERAKGQKQMLIRLFGKEKCLPDEPASKEAEPKFKAGDKIYVKDLLRVCTIKEIIYEYQKYELDGGMHYMWNDRNLKPYTVPIEDDDVLNAAQPKCIYYRNGKCGHPACVGDYDCDVAGCEDVVYQDGYNPTETKTNEDMEEKELNLCEILKGHEGETFFDLVNGNVILDTINNPVTGDIDFHTSDGYEVSYTDPWLTIHKSGSAIFYPSRDLYLKYPLDARAAWQEFIEANKQKVELRVDYTIHNGIFNGSSSLEPLRFNSVEEAEQAADLIRETLQKFHESKLSEK